MFKFYLQLSGLISSLEAAGYIITDDDLAMHLVTGLNGDYEVAAIYISGNLANMTWNEVLPYYCFMKAEMSLGMLEAKSNFAANHAKSWENQKKNGRANNGGKLNYGGKNGGGYQ